MRNYLFQLFFILPVMTNGQAVDTISILSRSMNKVLRCVVIKPGSYNKKTNYYPVVYLLHGHDGRYDNWITKMPSLKHYASVYNLLIVCPDGGNNSWYVNSPIDSSIQYETFIAYELIEHIDRKYKTLRNKNHRAITGLSMGGHGAIMLAMKHSDIFGAASSISGAMDLKEIAGRYDLLIRLGDTASNADHWKRYNILNIADTIKNRLQLLIDCGIKDGFIISNRALHKKLLERSISHSYIERAGGHSWSYWLNAIPFHLLFFRIFFDGTL